MPWSHGHPCVAIRVPLLAAGPGITKQTLCTDSDSLSQGDAYRWLMTTRSPERHALCSERHMRLILIGCVAGLHASCAHARPPKPCAHAGSCHLTGGTARASPRCGKRPLAARRAGSCDNSCARAAATSLRKPHTQLPQCRNQEPWLAAAQVSVLPWCAPNDGLIRDPALLHAIVILLCSEGHTPKP